MIQRIFCTAGCGLARHIAGKGIAGIHQSDQIVGQDMLQKKMEGMPMILMAQVAKFMKQDIILKGFRKADYVKVQIDVGS